MANFWSSQCKCACLFVACAVAARLSVLARFSRKRGGTFACFNPLICSGFIHINARAWLVMSSSIIWENGDDKFLNYFFWSVGSITTDSQSLNSSQPNLLINVQFYEPIDNFKHRNHHLHFFTLHNCYPTLSAWFKPASNFTASVWYIHSSCFITVIQYFKHNECRMVLLKRSYLSCNLPVLQASWNPTSWFESEFLWRDANSCDFLDSCNDFLQKLAKNHSIDPVYTAFLFGGIISFEIYSMTKVEMIYYGLLLSFEYDVEIHVDDLYKKSNWVLWCITIAVTLRCCWVYVNF